MRHLLRGLARPQIHVLEGAPLREPRNVGSRGRAKIPEYFSQEFGVGANRRGLGCY